MTSLTIYTDNLPAHAGGMTRGPFIFIRPKYKGDVGLLEHEKTHVAQWWIVTLLAVAIYVLPVRESAHRLLRHERKHLEQIERDGRLLFSIKYLWWLCRYGYWLNPYEIEARAAESNLQ